VRKDSREENIKEKTMKKHLGSKVTSALLSLMLLAMAIPPTDAAELPQPGQSKTVDAIKKDGKLRIGVMAGYPWLEENTSGQGEPYSGPAWILAKEYSKRLGVPLEVIPVSHETKVPVVQNGQAHMSIAPLSVTEPRKKVVDFVVYSNSSICMFGKVDNPKLAKVKSVDDLNRSDITIAYFSGAAEESWVPKRFPKAQSRGVSGSGTAAPVEEIMAGRSDVAPIDKISWVTLSKQVPGLKSWPEGEACLTSTEFSNPVGLAVPKGDDVFLEWARGVADELKETLQQEELRLIKKGEGS
jgi:polar amino acid transport system substrate-binding protein